jgi:superfamily II DNA or RNA helicase/phage anti-repressor protein
MLTTKTIGDSYEIFTFNSIKNDFDKIWLWRDIPESILFELNIIRNYDIFCKYRYDIGADLVAKKDNKYYFIQCKNFSDTILMADLAGFYFLLHEYNLNGILYYNGKLSQRVKDLTTGKIQFINLPFNNQTIINNIENKNDKLIPREYQLEAYNKLKNYDKCILSLPCGMGKTFIASLLANKYNNIIILSPLRYLSQQLLINMSNYLNSDYNPILISMDGHRDLDIIKKFIKNKNIFSCTYDSADIMVQLLDTLDNIYLIVDEFHNLSYNNLNNENDYIYQIINKLNKQLYLSATPIQDFICDYKYEYSWSDAIQNKYICDFNIIIHENNEELYKFSYLLKQLCSNSLDIKLIGKAYFILKGLMYYGNKKCICYMTCIDKANQLSEILYWMSYLLNIQLNKWIINCNTARTKRVKYLEEFKKSINLSIMINVHILDEGIDIPECDSVFITRPSNNIHNIVQRMSRSNRIYKNKEICNIFLWCSKNKTNKVLNYLSNNTNAIIDNKIIKFKIINNNIVKQEKYKMINNNTSIMCDDNIIDDNNNNDLIQFIKSKFPDIPEIFYPFYDEGKTEYDYTINLEKIASWLEVRKEHLKDLLINNFKENEDYIELKNTNNGKGIGRGKNNRKIIMLKYMCAKELCMISRTKKSQIIRKFFIDVEKLLITHKI